MKLRHSLLLLGSALLAFATTAKAATLSWDGGGATTTWSTPENWNTTTNTDATPISTSDITFNNTVTGALDTTIGATYTVRSLNFTSAQTSPVIIRTTNANPLTLSGAATNDISVQAGDHTFIGSNAGPNTKDFIFTKGTTNIINIATGASFTIQARVGQTDTTSAIYQKTGGGTLVLAGDNGSGGSWNVDNNGNSGKGFAIDEGALRFAATRAFGNSGNKFTVATGAALEITGGVTQNISTGSATFTLNGSGIGDTGALRSLSGSNVFSMSAGATGGIVLASDSSIGVDADTLTISQVVSSSGTRSLTKVGAGTLTLSNASNSYSGATNINAGTLNITGSKVASSAVNVGGSAASGSPKLAGSGTVNGAVTLKSANDGAVGILNAGNSTLANKVGTLTIGSSLDFESGSIFEWDLNANKDTDGLDNDLGTTGDNGVAGTDFDLVNVGGNLSINAVAVFKVIQNAGVVFTDAFWDENQTWTNIFNVTGTTTGALWSNTAVSVYNTSGVLQDVSSYGSFSITGTTLSWQAIPEPTTALAGLLLTAGLLRRRRHPGYPASRSGAPAVS